MPTTAKSADLSTETDIRSVINLLDENTANRIAAGEVIERPSSVVKELVENAIDAGATRIEVELEDGGKRRIIVRDNGCGMGREDAILSLQRHATSKIRSSDDLFFIRTLGFRGEALPSIASVSDFFVTTRRPEDETATELIARGGDIDIVREAADNPGTTITVENLFFNVPARLKFLKTTQTELNHATDLIQRLILAYHGISFRLIHDGYEMISYPGATDPRHAVAAVWGRDSAREMVPLSYQSPAISVRGFLSKPSLTKATRTAQAFFVNGRFVRSRTIQHAFDAAYRNLIQGDRHPVVALFIDIAPELVDVNVHPAKVEVRFTRDGDVYSAVHRAVQDAMLTGGLMPEVSVIASTPSTVTPSLPPKVALSSFGGLVDIMPETNFHPQDAPNSTFPTNAGSERDWRSSPDAPSPPSVSSLPFSLERKPESTTVPSAYLGFDGQRIGRLRVLGQSRNTYIIAETDDAILLIDQHIAHERVLYEQLMNGATEGASRWGVVAQHLALPQTIEFAPREAKVTEERQDALAQAGFLIDPFGGGTFVVRAVPARLAGKDYLGALREIVEELTSVSVSRRLMVPHESALIMASCKMAVKKGDPLTMEEMTRLLSDLAQMKNPFTCPHGRPVLLTLSHSEMDRKFHRTGTH